jgi:hypothetical protein
MPTSYRVTFPGRAIEPLDVEVPLYREPLDVIPDEVAKHLRIPNYDVVLGDDRGFMRPSGSPDPRGTRFDFEQIDEPGDSADGAPCCPDPECAGSPCTFPGFAANH